MAFQFLCPNGHLLEGDEGLAGQQCQCPYCAILFIVPTPVGQGMAMQAPPPLGGDPAPSPGAPFQDPASAEIDVPQIRVGPDFGETPAGDVPSAEQLPGGAPAQLVHVLCPSGHTLETPPEMLGQDAMCPYCQAVFRLRREDSLEYRKEKEEERERLERRRGLLWMRWSIATAAVVILGVIILVMLAASR